MQATIYLKWEKKSKCTKSLKGSQIKKLGKNSIFLLINSLICFYNTFTIVILAAYSDHPLIWKCFMIFSLRENISVFSLVY